MRKRKARIKWERGEDSGGHEGERRGNEGAVEGEESSKEK